MANELMTRVFISMKLVDTRMYPKMMREYFFLRGVVKYYKRKSFHKNGWQEMLRQAPRLLGLNITDVCNARCCYCAYRFHKPEGVMSLQIFEKAVREFDEMGGGVIGLSTLTGEPLLDPHLFQRIEFARQLPNIHRIFLASNGIGFKDTGLADRMIEAASRIDIKIDISLPGFEEKMFERVYGVGHYREVLRGTSHLLKANRDKGSPLDISLHLQPDRGGIFNDPDYKDFIRPYIGAGKVLNSSRVENNWCGQIKQEHLTGEMILRRPAKARDLPCQYMLDGNIDVLVNGDVRLCGCTYGEEGKHDSLVIGNINEKSLSEIWFGNGPVGLCEQFLKSELPAPCRKCFMYEPY